MAKKMNQTYPSFNEELFLWQQGYAFIAGVDEVGRGSFAGPIVAAAVILPPDFTVGGVNDSKVLSSKKREELSESIKKYAICYSIAEVAVAYINKYGISKANHRVFRKVIYKIIQNLDIKQLYSEHAYNRTNELFVLVDGFQIRDLRNIRLKQQKAIVKGDQLSVSIAAASIIAKVYRDKLMSSLPIRYERYAFRINKGYGTKFHREAIYKYGLSDLHRTSFNLQKYLSE